ncbi:peroxisomal targeting signal 2 receptor [Dimargaris xerosporica]|nr:peroxisomal targeting signal 2 receptor [Dimargaris xerosporica]
MAMQQLLTPGFHGYSVKFSPFYDDLMACGGASNFGLVGNGRLTVARRTPQGIIPDKTYDTQDGVFDCSWNELNEHQLATCGGDGSVKLWDLNVAQYPIMNWREHDREAFAVEWNYTRKDCFLTGSWDTTLKLWRPDQSKSIATWKGHSQCVYAVAWCPHQPDVFASASGDGSVKLWDCKSPQPLQSLATHAQEVLTVDWNKYRPNVLATGSVDKSIKLWDVRQPRRELEQLQGHDYAVRRVRFSPYHANILASASYDMTIRLWDINIPMGQPLRSILDHHTEFVFGIDFSLHTQGQLATYSWDERATVVQIPDLG